MILRVSLWDCARGIFPPREHFPGPPLNSRAELGKKECVGGSTAKGDLKGGAVVFFSSRFLGFSRVFLLFSPRFPLVFSSFSLRFLVVLKYKKTRENYEKTRHLEAL